MPMFNHALKPMFFFCQGEVIITPDWVTPQSCLVSPQSFLYYMPDTKVFFKKGLAVLFLSFLKDAEYR